MWNNYKTLQIYLTFEIEMKGFLDCFVFSWLMCRQVLPLQDFVTVMFVRREETRNCFQISEGFSQYFVQETQNSAGRCLGSSVAALGGLTIKFLI